MSEAQKEIRSRISDELKKAYESLMGIPGNEMGGTVASIRLGKIAGLIKALNIIDDEIKKCAH